MSIGRFRKYFDKYLQDLSIEYDNGNFEESTRILQKPFNDALKDLDGRMEKIKMRRIRFPSSYYDSLIIGVYSDWVKDWFGVKK